MARRSNGEGTIGKTIRNGKEYWRYTITTGYDLEGKQIRKQFYGKTQKEAKDKYKEWQSKQNFKSDDKLTFGSYFHTWLFEFRKMELKSSTFERYFGIYQNYVMANPKLANTRLTDLTTEQLQKYYNTLIKNGKNGDSVKTINRYIKTFLSDCVKQGIILRNPCDNVKFPKSFEVKEDDEDQFIDLTDSEQKLFVKAIEGDDMEIIILLGLCCGMRLGEILALEIKDFDFKDNWITIKKSLKRVSKIDETGKKNYVIEITGPKTKAGIRKCPLPKFLVPKIKAQHRINLENKSNLDTYCCSGLLFCNTDGTPIDSKKPNRRVRSICKKLKLSDKIHFHSLRSIFISNCCNKNIDIKTVMSWVGHADYQTTMNIYARIKKEKLQESSEIVNSIFDDILE